ncbi:UNVERIFIED_CONTAM: Dual specificity protein phosphatase 1 [Sesamum angustifolium]|uniref:Dual specificity protein phosphatase 1 n=1 Tax=Sesamum angustifolium TaxID=2727405 RepID=A0AAW2P1T9_9LAMI
MNSDMYKERIAALLKVIQATKIVKEDNIPCKIEEGLYLGSLGAANNRSALKSLNITHILTIAISLAPAHPNDFRYKIVEGRIFFPDREDISITQYFDECFAFIDEARARGGGVLVHCFAGRSRSVTVVVGYLMFKNGMSFTEALQYVKTKRPVASPNSGFMLQLQEYERSLQASRTGTVLEPEKCCSSL